jgi:beta-lactamase superfamily II metal-dependent hydrolase
MGIRFDFLPSGSGDCTLVQTDDCVILIDTGDYNYLVASAIKNKIYQILKIRLEQGKSTRINHVILTHIDDDHIGGMRILANDDSFMQIIDNIWFNYPNATTTIFNTKDESNRNSVRKADKIRELVATKKIHHIGNIDLNNKSPLSITQNLSLTLLSPRAVDRLKLESNWLESYPNNKNSSLIENPEDDLETLAYTPFHSDKSLPNSASIAFDLTYKESGKIYNFLFLADSYPDVIAESLIKLKYSPKNPFFVDFVKVSHHGSKRNTNLELLGLIRANTFIIMTNGYKKPDKETIARLIFNKKLGEQKIIITQASALKEILKKSFFKKYQNEFIHQDYLEF